MPETRNASVAGIRARNAGRTGRLSQAQINAFSGLTGRARRRAAAAVGVRAGVGNTEFRDRGARPTNRRNRSTARTVAGTGIGGRRTRATTPGGITSAVQNAIRRQGAARR